MKNMLIHNPAKQDNIEAMADAMVESMRYVNPSVDYPDVSDVKRDDGVVAEWFYKAYAGTTPSSELTAILQYTQQRMIFDEISETFLGIALTEMKHYDRLGEVIQKLGGKVERPSYSAAKVSITTVSPQEAVRINIASEQATIDDYNELIKVITDNNPKITRTAEIAVQLINKIIADEQVHVRILTDLLNSLPDEQQ